MREDPSDVFRLETAFAVLVVVFGLLYALVTPPFQVPDEEQHFFRAFGVSEGRWVPISQGGASGDRLPANLYHVAARLLDGVPFHADVRVDTDAIREALATRLQAENRAFVPFLTSAYSFLPYLPPALGIAVARVFSDSVLVLFYAGRIASVAVSALLLIAALRKTPVGKPIFFLLSLAPMAMFEMASVSADGFTNSFCFFFTAAMLQAAFGDGRIGRRTVTFWIVLSVVLGLTKPAYAFFSGLVFLVPAGRFGSAARRAAVGIGMLAASTGSALLWSWTIRKLYPPFHGAVGLDPHGQLAELLEHPLRVLATLVSFYGREAAALANQYVGKLGWVDTHLPVAFVVSYFLLLCAVAATNGWTDPVLGRTRRAVLWTVLGITLGFMTLLLWVVFTPPGIATVRSVQGRYFIPLGPIAFLTLSNRRLRLDWNRGRPWLVGAGALAGLVALAAIVRRFYG